RFSRDWSSDVCSSDLGAEIIIESTGLFLTKPDGQKHINAGAKKVVFSAPAKDDTPTFVMGVNHKQLTADQTIVSNASCTTNCLRSEERRVGKESRSAN